METPIQKIINDYLKKTGKTKKQLALDCDVSQPYIGMLSNGKLSNVSLEKISSLAKGMGMKPAELSSLLSGAKNYSNVRNLSEAGFTMIPLFSSLSCGTGILVDENAESFVPMPDQWKSPGKRYFANTASGDSMLNANIHDGDVLIFERTDDLENGEIGSFWYDGENYCKTFRQVNGDTVVLESANPQYDPIVINLKDSDFRILGRLKYQMAIRS